MKASVALKCLMASSITLPPVLLARSRFGDTLNVEHIVCKRVLGVGHLVRDSSLPLSLDRLVLTFGSLPLVPFLIPFWFLSISGGSWVMIVFV